VRLSETITFGMSHPTEELVQLVCGDLVLFKSKPQGFSNGTRAPGISTGIQDLLV
jgi:hypothetical protein